MFLLREPLWMIALCGAVGYFCGWGKGRAGFGLLLGLIFGPFGCLAIMLWPPAPRRSRPNASASASSEAPAGGPACPRCRKPAARSARVCPHCGNVLAPIRYAIE